MSAINLSTMGPNNHEALQAKADAAAKGNHTEIKSNKRDVDEAMLDSDSSAADDFDLDAVFAKPLATADEKIKKKVRLEAEGVARERVVAAGPAPASAVVKHLQFAPGAAARTDAVELPPLGDAPDDVEVASPEKATTKPRDDTPRPAKGGGRKPFGTYRRVEFDARNGPSKVGKGRAAGSGMGELEKTLAALVAAVDAVEEPNGYFTTLPKKKFLEKNGFATEAETLYDVREVDDNGPVDPAIVLEQVRNYQACKEMGAKCDSAMMKNMYETEMAKIVQALGYEPEDPTIDEPANRPITSTPNVVKHWLHAYREDVVDFKNTATHVQAFLAAAKYLMQRQEPGVRFSFDNGINNAALFASLSAICGKAAGAFRDAANEIQAIVSVVGEVDDNGDSVIDGLAVSNISKLVDAERKVIDKESPVPGGITKARKPAKYLAWHVKEGLYSRCKDRAKALKSLAENTPRPKARRTKKKTDDEALSEVEEEEEE